MTALHSPLKKLQPPEDGWSVENRSARNSSKLCLIPFEFPEVELYPILCIVVLCTVCVHLRKIPQRLCIVVRSIQRVSNSIGYSSRPICLSSKIIGISRSCCGLMLRNRSCCGCNVRLDFRTRPWQRNKRQRRITREPRISNRLQISNFNNLLCNDNRRLRIERRFGVHRLGIKSQCGTKKTLTQSTHKSTSSFYFLKQSNTLSPFNSEWIKQSLQTAHRSRTMEQRRHCSQSC